MTWESKDAAHFPESNLSLDLPKNHQRYYQIGGLTIKIQADLPITENTFHPKFKPFEIPPTPVPDITLMHHFGLPSQEKIKPLIQDSPIHRHPPWAIYALENSWLYHGLSPEGKTTSPHKVAFFSLDHTRGEIYSPDDTLFRQGRLNSLSMFPTDQIFLSRVLTDRQGCLLHGAGMILSGQGLLFAGHSEAGKSTITNLLRDEGEILCDDRIILSQGPEGFRIHGTWSHGDIPDISPASAPLRAILFLEQAPVNELILLKDKKEMVRRLLFLVIRPLVTQDWWEKVLALITPLVREVPGYVLKFRKDGGVLEEIERLLRGNDRFGSSNLNPKNK